MTAHSETIDPKIKYMYRLAQGRENLQNRFSSHTNQRTGSVHGRQSVSATPTNHCFDRERNIIAVLARVVKIWWEIKNFVNSACGDKTLSINLINWIIKSIKDKKMPQWQNNHCYNGCCCPLPSRKTSSKTVNATNIKKALANSPAIFKPRRHQLSF